MSDSFSSAYRCNKNDGTLFCLRIELAIILAFTVVNCTRRRKHSSTFSGGYFKT